MKKARKLLFFTMLSAFQGMAQFAKIAPYQAGEGLSFTTSSGASLKLGGFFQPMVEFKDYPKMADNGVSTRFRIRRMVARLTGSAKEAAIKYQLQIDLTGNSDGGGDATTNNYLMDAWGAWKPMRQLEIVAGQENSITDSREMTMVSGALQFPERSPLALAFSSVREFGFFLNGRFRTGKQSIFLPSISVTNGDGPNVFSKDRGGLKFGGRLDFQPFGSFANGGASREVDMERERTLKLVAGVFGSVNQGISDRRGSQSGTYIYLDSLGREVLPDYTKIGADFLLKYRGFTLSGEWVKSSASVPASIFNRIRTDGSTASTFLVNNIQDMPAYVRNRLILGSGVNFQAGYLFKNLYSVDARFCRLFPAQYSFLRNPTYYNRSKFFTLGFSRYLERSYGARIQASLTYSIAEPGSQTLDGLSLIGNDLGGTIMLVFSL
jgi:hypothetical protein